MGDRLRVVRLFGKAYWWDRTADGRLTLARATWIKDEKEVCCAR
ncbi:hypothetical protein [Streptomyces sp. NPDC005244]